MLPTLSKAGSSARVSEIIPVEAAVGGGSPLAATFFPHLHRCFLACLDAVGVMFHNLQWHSTGRLLLKQARIRAENRGE